MKTEIEMKFDTKEAQKIYADLKKENVLLKQDLKKAKFIIEQLMNMKNYSADEQTEVIKKAKAFLH
jgi:hypothetical protein